ncbi:MAG: SDR family NAD(P)-dependent oxidoreductase [SAR86 cluster bacterium]|uniref:SDR family NAD(P)-dependent oxidoreductase n=1 Tax=SAR86 cluster bacterium TaxID=2030880 RepID=A0A368BXP8_9GAMM|nr:MAG: SDR family NAD(P)-dependent oxidoreductase [SAR86 cluster bacterium]
MKWTNNKTILITGATNGIGKAAAIKFAESAKSIAFTYRNEELAEDLKNEMQKINPNLSINSFVCDFSVQDSIRECADKIKNDLKAIDLLINNAGVVNTEYSETIDGIENTFAVNHLGYFLFTNLLLDLVKKESESRIINVSSAAHHFVKGMQWDDINYKDDFKMGLKAYGQSKLGNILFTKQLAKKLQKDGVTVNAIHPGGVNTSLGNQNNSLLGRVLKIILKPFFRSPLKGANTIIYLAEIDCLSITGAYWVDGRVAKTSHYSKNEAEAEKLWRLSEKLVNQEFEI